MRKLFRSIGIFLGIISPYQYYKVPLIVEWPLFPGTNLYANHPVAKKKPIRIEKATNQIQGYVPDLETDWRGRIVEKYHWKNLPVEYKNELNFQLKKRFPEMRIHRSDYKQSA